MDKIKQITSASASGLGGACGQVDQLSGNRIKMQRWVAFPNDWWHSLMMVRERERGKEGERESSQTRGTLHLHKHVLWELQSFYIKQRFFRRMSDKWMKDISLCITS